MGFKKVSHIDGGFAAIKQSKFKIFRSYTRQEHNPTYPGFKNFIVNYKCWSAKDILSKALLVNSFNSSLIF